VRQGFDYTDLGLEAQAEVVEDWFLGHPAKPTHPDPRNHTGKPMDCTEPYYRYITHNVRVGTSDEARGNNWGRGGESPCRVGVGWRNRRVLSRAHSAT